MKKSLLLDYIWTLGENLSACPTKSVNYTDLIPFKLSVCRDHKFRLPKKAEELSWTSEETDFDEQGKKVSKTYVIRDLAGSQRSDW